MKSLRSAEGDRREPRVLRVLLLEGSLSEAESVRAHLSDGGLHCELSLVASPEAFRARLEREDADIILADYTPPGFDGLSALELAKSVRPGVPFIYISGAPGEEAAINAVKSGAADYVPEHDLDRLVPAIRRAVREAAGRPRREHQTARGDEEEYRAMFEFAGVGSLRADPRTGRLLRVNPKLCRITGYSEDELLDMTFADLVHPDGRARDREHFLEVARGEELEYSVEQRYVRKDGKVIWVSVDASPIRDDNGRPSGVVAMIQDVTERKQNENELARLASFPKLSPILIIEASVAGEPTFVNAAAQRRFPRTIDSGRHPILADLAAVNREITKSGGKPVTDEVWVDGLLYQRFVFAAPGSDLLRLYVTDVTERRRAEEALKRSEERFRSLVRYASDIIMILDAEGVMLYESPAVERVLGFRPEDRIGTDTLSYLHPDDLATVRSGIAALLEEPDRRLAVEYRARDVDGNWRHFEAICTNLLEDPIVCGIVVNARDITERHRAEDALRKSEERFRWTFEQAAENFFVVDLQTRRILDANAALQHSLGYTLEELKGKTLYDLVAADQESVDQNIDRIMAEGSTFVGERQYCRKDGSTVDVEVNAGAIPYGDTRAVCVVAHDITERKQTETALRQNLSVLLALREAGQVLSSTLESEEIVTRLLEIMRSVAGLTAAVVSRYDREGNMRVWRSAGLESLWPRVRFMPEAEDARQAALENEGRQLFRLRRPGFEDEYLAGLCLPLKVRNRTTGVLEAYGKDSLRDNDMIEIISSLAGQAAGALENAGLYEALGNRERSLQDLVTKLLGAQEEERRRVAYEVHDGLAQVAVAAHQNLQAFARRHAPESERGRKELDLVLRQVRATVSDARRVIANLRPTALDDLGLAAAISLEVERLNEEGYRVDYDEHLGPDRLPADMEITLFRVAQEALTNMRKHARTRWVSIDLRREDEKVCLEVRDYGRGFDPTTMEVLGGGPGERVGLAGMRERVGMLGGTLQVKGRPGAGTSIVATIPLARPS